MGGLSGPLQLAGRCPQVRRALPIGCLRARLLGVQRPLLVSVLKDLHGQGSDNDQQALDFACGSGRITGAVRDAGWSVVGLDASGAMLEVARLRLPDVEFCEGRLGESNADDWVSARGSFQLVTAFRFFLNAPADQRLAVLQLLVARMTPHGHLVLNNHGSGPSLRNLGLRLRRKPGATTITQRAFVELLHAAGLRVERQWGGQLFPRSLYGVTDRGPSRASDRAHHAEDLRWSSTCSSVRRQSDVRVS